MSARFALMAAALWWGSLSAIGFMAVPLLFAHLPTPALAGNTAAHLFAAQAWMSLGCGVFLLFTLKSQSLAGEQPNNNLNHVRNTLVLVLFGMLLAMLVEYGVSPRIVARQNLRLWHGLGSVLYVLQWLAAGIVLWRLAGSRSTRT